MITIPPTTRATSPPAPPSAWPRLGPPGLPPEGPPPPPAPPRKGSCEARCRAKRLASSANEGPRPAIFRLVWVGVVERREKEAPHRIPRIDSAAGFTREIRGRCTTASRALLTHSINTGLVPGCRLDFPQLVLLFKVDIRTRNSLSLVSSAPDCDSRP